MAGPVRRRAVGISIHRIGDRRAADQPEFRDWWRDGGPASVLAGASCGGEAAACSYALGPWACGTGRPHELWSPWGGGEPGGDLRSDLSHKKPIICKAPLQRAPTKCPRRQSKTFIAFEASSEPFGDVLSDLIATVLGHEYVRSPATTMPTLSPFSKFMHWLASVPQKKTAEKSTTSSV